MDESLSVSRTAGESSGSSKPSKTAESIAVIRAKESSKPEDERICYDPYAFRFISPERAQVAVVHPKDMADKAEYSQPGHINSILARVRFIDDVVKSAAGDGLEQLVILGAGYDTRAYRIESLAKIRTFEVDHPNTQRIKKEKVAEIFGYLPAHVTYVPEDFTASQPGRQLLDSGYDQSRKTLFIMEGLLMYLPPGAVDGLLAFIAGNAGKGSAIVFDYVPLAAYEYGPGKMMRQRLAASGEPIQFGISEGALEAFLASRGFSKIRNFTSDDYRRMYFHGKNEARKVNPLVLFAYAEIE